MDPPDESIREVARRLLALAPGIREIWALGSQVNGAATAQSDLDLFVIADAAGIEALRRAAPPRPDLDVCVSTDGDSFTDLWGDPARPKSFSLRDDLWNWQAVAIDEATYTGRKGNMVATLRAFRIVGGRG